MMKNKILKELPKSLVWSALVFTALLLSSFWWKTESWTTVEVVLLFLICLAGGFGYSLSMTQVKRPNS